MLCFAQKSIPNITKGSDDFDCNKKVKGQTNKQTKNSIYEYRTEKSRKVKREMKNKNLLMMQKRWE